MSYGLRLDTADHRSALIVVAGFLASFVFIRISTRLMRSPRVPWWPGSIKTDGVHIHHMVFGIIGLMVSGFLIIAIDPGSPGMEILSALFGISAGLTIDEFALWLYVEDVYWAKEGRASTDAAIVCAACAILVVVGAAEGYHGSWLVILIAVVEQLLWAGVCVAKGKARLAVVAFVIPFIGVIAAIRLARPHSWWARRRYKPGSKKLAKATRRAAKWDARRDRWLDFIGGAPSIELPPRGAAAAVAPEPEPAPAPVASPSAQEELRGPGKPFPSPRSGGES